ncbi:hypothetical protein N8T08_004780 [Aspergillus melleus]|uniref:Uncharacterized protein n=1 Tax=Aspergillus melleus TaxID=138277 RepID=A0ACC3B405_9EURO|nr:hypothetical protein N8T08_004780 [Aspergillus melleus]
MDNSVKLTEFTALATAVVVFLNLLAGDHPTSTTSESGNASDRILIGRTIGVLQMLSEGQPQSLCGQCHKALADLIYSSQTLDRGGSRQIAMPGLPQGYITHLETRLASTEHALFAVYEHLRSLGLHTEIPEGLGEQQPSRSQTRVAKMAEWERLPLNARGDLERWWAERRGGVAGYSDGYPTPRFEFAFKNSDLQVPKSQKVVTGFNFSVQERAIADSFHEEVCSSHAGGLMKEHATPTRFFSHKGILLFRIQLGELVHINVSPATVLRCSIAMVFEYHGPYQSFNHRIRLVIYIIVVVGPSEPQGFEIQLDLKLIGVLYHGFPMMTDSLSQEEGALVDLEQDCF